MEMEIKSKQNRMIATCKGKLNLEIYKMSPTLQWIKASWAHNCVLNVSINNISKM